MTHDTLDGANAVLRGIKRRRNPTLMMVQAIILGIILALFGADFLDDAMMLGLAAQLAVQR